MSDLISVPRNGKESGRRERRRRRRALEVVKKYKEGQNPGARGRSNVASGGGLALGDSMRLSQPVKQSTRTEDLYSNHRHPF